MTTEEFYASALIAALPYAQTVNPASRSLTSVPGECEKTVAENAHQYAAALTAVFEQNRRSYVTQQPQVKDWEQS